MSIGLTIEQLNHILGREVDELNLTVAKAIVMGMDVETLAATMGVPEPELRELIESQDYKDVRLLVGAEEVKSRLDRDGGWDGLEHTALGKLNKRVVHENDTDTLLRIAAVANKASRKVAPPKESVLDPSQAGVRIPLTLTRRFTEKLTTSQGMLERSETQQISVLNGSAVNPTFQEVSHLLQVQGGAPIADAYRELPPQCDPQKSQPVHEPESFDMAELLKTVDALRN